MVANPFFGKLSDRTSSRLGMRRPWMVVGLLGGSLGVLVVALAPSIPVVLAGWCLAQMLNNALLAAMVAVLPDQVPTAQRGLVSGVLGVCLPVASVGGTYLVQLFTGNQMAMFLVPCAVGGFFVLLFALTLDDRRLARAERPAWSLRELAGTFYVSPRRNPDFAWAFVSRFLFVLAYAFLTTYQAYYLLQEVGSAEADVPRQIFLGTLAQSALVAVASVVGGRLSDRTGRRKVFVCVAALVYGSALFLLAIASDFDGYLLGMAVGGLGFGLYTAVDLALVADVLPSEDNARTSASSTSPARCRSRSRPRWLRSSCRSPTATTACCSVSPAPAPCWRARRSSVSGGCADAASPAAHEVELLPPADGRPPACDAELGVDVLGVRPDGVQRHEQLAGDTWAVQVGGQQP